MTSVSAVGLKIGELLQADSAHGPPDGGRRSGVRPGRKGLVLKTYEAPSISWTGRANRFRPPRGGLLSW